MSPSKEKTHKFMGLVGEAVELIPQDFIQLQLVDYLDVIAVILWKKCGEMCVIYIPLLGPSNGRILHKRKLAMYFRNINTHAFDSVIPVLGISSKETTNKCMNL